MIYIMEDANELTGLLVEQTVTWSNLEEGLRQSEIKYLFNEDGEAVGEAQKNFITKAGEWINEQFAKLVAYVNRIIARLTLKFGDAKKYLGAKVDAEKAKGTVRVSQAFIDYTPICAAAIQARKKIATAIKTVEKGSFDAPSLKTLVEKIKGDAGAKNGLVAAKAAAEYTNKAQLIIEDAPKSLNLLRQMETDASTAVKAAKAKAAKGKSLKDINEIKRLYKEMQDSRALLGLVSRAISVFTSQIISAFASAVSVMSTATGSKSAASTEGGEDKKPEDKGPEKTNEAFEFEGGDLFTYGLDEETQLELMSAELELGLTEVTEELVNEEVVEEDSDLSLSLEEELELDEMDFMDGIE